MGAVYFRPVKNETLYTLPDRLRMSSDSQKVLAQIAFNLLLIILLLIALFAVLKEIFSPGGDLKQALFLFVLLIVVLFIGIGFLVRLIRSVGHTKEP